MEEERLDSGCRNSERPVPDDHLPRRSHGPSETRRRSNASSSSTTFGCCSCIASIQHQTVASHRTLHASALIAGGGESRQNLERGTLMQIVPAGFKNTAQS